MSTIYDCNDPAKRGGAITLAAASVSEGNLVVLPTDTLYGVGADAFNREAVGNLLAAKNRGPDYPVPVLIGSWDTVPGLVAHYTEQLKKLVEKFWPGGLSIVVDQAPSLPIDVGYTAGTIMLRMPLHPVAIQLLRQTGPMAVSSANIHGHQPPTTVIEAKRQLGKAIDVYLDGGTAPMGQPSTIIDIHDRVPRILREGAISAEELAEVLDFDPQTLRGEGS